MGLSNLLNSIRSLTLGFESYSWTDAPEGSEQETLDSSTLFDNQQPNSTSRREISPSSSSSFNMTEDDPQTSDQTCIEEKDEGADHSSETENVYYTLIQKRVYQTTPLSQLVILKTATQEATLRRLFQGNEVKIEEWYEAICQEICISTQIHQRTCWDPFTLRHSCVRS
jgi:hypothetical protein